ncbi:MAG: PQQ-binding-like beta-propeller repeat protein [Crocinitomicaceae bacterium]|nr:PQQ-binding-like beta-propeller repeat protein [Crocinitomicaceae bacterium]
MKKIVVISIVTLVSALGIIIGIWYFNSLSKINKSFSIFVTEDVQFIVKTDNLNMLKKHVQNSAIHGHMQGTKSLDVGFKKLLELDSVFHHLNTPFEYYNNMKFYCMIENSGHSYLVMEAPYQIDLKKFGELLKVDVENKLDEHIYTFHKQKVFVMGRFAVFSDNLDFLNNIKSLKQIPELDQLDASFVSDAYCQAFEKKENWQIFDILIEKSFVQLPAVSKGAEYESYGNFEDRELLYFVPKDIENMEWVKSKSPFLEIQKIYQNNVQLDPELTSWVNGSIAKFENAQGSYLLIRVSDQMAPSGQLESATISNLNLDTDSLEHFKVNEHVVYQFDPAKNYSEIFNSTVKYKWYSEVSSFVIFADSRTAMTNYFAQFDQGELINFDASFSSFMQSFPSKANYLKLERNPKQIDYPGSINPENMLMANSILISDNLTFKNRGYFQYGNTTTQIVGTSTVLEFPLPFNVDVFIPIRDHIDGGNSYFLSSSDGNISFVDKDGKEKWKAKVDGKIIGTPKIIDLFGNNKKQIIFNTETKLYLLDIKGNNVEKFPYVIPGKASNSVSVLDYDKNNNYRFMVATQDKKILNIGEEGLPVEGWEFKSTDGLVKGDINHFIISGKDYIFFSDATGKIFMLNRRGQERIDEQITSNKQYQYFQKGKDILSTRLFSVTPQKIYTITLDGHSDSIDLEISKPYKFIEFKDFDGDGLKEFIFISSGYINIINQFGLISRQIPSPSENVSKVELIYESGKLQNIVLFDYVKEELSVVDINGSVIEGFPVSCKKYLGSFQKDKNIVNCIVDEKNVRLVQN